MNELIFIDVLVSSYFGFGLMDASKMVLYAKSWSTVPEQLRCEVKPLKNGRYGSVG